MRVNGLNRLMTASFSESKKRTKLCMLGGSFKGAKRANRVAKKLIERYPERYKTFE